MTVGRLQPFGNCPQSDDCHEDGGPTINKAIIITRHVGRRHPTTNQSNIKMLDLMMMVIIVPIIIIIIIIGMSIPNTQSRPKNAGHTIPQGGRGEPPQPDHREGGSNPPPHHTTGGGGGVGRNHWGGEGGGGTAEPGSYIYIYIYILVFWGLLYYFILGTTPPPPRTPQNPATSKARHGVQREVRLGCCRIRTPLGSCYVEWHATNQVLNLKS